MALIYLGLGTNLGDKILNLNTAIQQIGIEIGEVWNISAFTRRRHGDTTLQTAS